MTKSQTILRVYVQRRCTLLLLVLASVVGHTDRRLSSKGFAVHHQRPGYPVFLALADLSVANISRRRMALMRDW